MRFRRNHRSGFRRQRTRKLYWVRYSGILEIVPASGNNPAQTVLLDPNQFEPSSTGTYAADINREVTLHRLKMHYMATCQQFGTTAGNATVVTAYLGIRVGAALPIPSPSNGAVLDQRCDWLDLWEDNAPNPPAGTGNVSFNTGEQGQTSRDVKTKRILEGNNMVLFLDGKIFPDGDGTFGSVLGDDPRWWMSFHVSMLLSRAT